MKNLKDIDHRNAAGIRKHEILVACNRIRYLCCGAGHLVDETLDLEVLEAILQPLETALNKAEDNYN